LSVDTNTLLKKKNTKKRVIIGFKKLKRWGTDGNLVKVSTQIPCCRARNTTNKKITQFSLD
jgi:hypothetical protein